MGKRLTGCSCCGGVRICGCKQGFPSYWTFSITSAAHIDPGFGLCFPLFPVGEDPDAECASLVGMYILTGPIEKDCYSGTSPFITVRKSFIWLSSIININGTADDSTINCSINPALTCPLHYPDQYQFRLRLSYNAEDLTDCSWDLALLPTYVLTHRYDAIQLAFSNQIIPIDYPLDPLCQETLYTLPGGIGPIFLYDDIVINDCLSMRWDFDQVEYEKIGGTFGNSFDCAAIPVINNGFDRPLVCNAPNMITLRGIY